MIEISIDGKKIKSEIGKSIIQVADEAGIYIPRFCYHKKLSVAANCRMCLVEVEKSPKTLPACSTHITDGMVVSTKSSQTRKSQKAVMEFLLRNHPLDCPVCDQGGVCDLQDLAMGFGKIEEAYDDTKRVVKDQNLGPLVETAMTRCILCTRCVRFGEEIGGNQDLGVMGRGENSYIGMSSKNMLESSVSGNIIDICPVGSLVSKPSKFIGRSWEMRQLPSISLHDCVGSNIYVHTINNKVIRTISRKNEDINSVWISDRDRFSYSAVDSKDRCIEPMILEDGEWKTTSFKKAIKFASVGLKNIIEKYGNNSFGSLASSNLTTEEYFLLQKISRYFGNNNLDNRLKDESFCYNKLDINSISSHKGLLLLGLNPEIEQPILAIKIREAIKNGTKVVGMHWLSADNKMSNFTKINMGINKWLGILVSAAASLDIALPKELQKYVYNFSKEVSIILDVLRKKNSLILMGSSFLQNPNAQLLQYIVNLIVEKLNISKFALFDGANNIGARMAGFAPHKLPENENSFKPGYSFREMVNSNLSAYIMSDIENSSDTSLSSTLHNALNKAEFVIQFTSYVNDEMLNYSNVIIPKSTFFENEGTTYNLSGIRQSFSPVYKSKVLPFWQIIQEFSQNLGLQSVDYKDIIELSNNIKNVDLDSDENICQTNNISLDAQLYRVSYWPIYNVDSIVKRSKPLQESFLAMEECAFMNEETLHNNNLNIDSVVRFKQNEDIFELKVKVNNSLSSKCIFIPVGFLESKVKGSLYGNLTIIK